MRLTFVDLIYHLLNKKAIKLWDLFLHFIGSNYRLNSPSNDGSVENPSDSQAALWALIPRWCWAAIGDSDN